MNAEQERFTAYLKTYRITPPLNSPKVTGAPTAKAHAAIQTRTSRYGDGKMTPAAMAQAKSQGQ